MQRIKCLRPVWAEINLDNLAHNVREVRRLIGSDFLITAIVKADGYGHGAVQIGEILLQSGADRFAVSTLSEAIQMRKYYQSTPILILGYTPDEFVEDIIKFNIIQTIYTYDQAQIISEKAKELNKKAIIHIKIDTGMHRLGMKVEDRTIDIIKKIIKLPNIYVEGIFSHFAVADEEDKSFSYEQAEKFKYICDKLEADGINIPIKHLSNSAGIIDLPEMNCNMVRAGIMLYGLYPSNEVDKSKVHLREVMSLKAKISHIKEIEAGEGVSYGLIYKTKKRTQVATLPLGYADGYTRMLTNKAEVLVKGNKVPVVGRICMDQCMIDITGIEANRGDIVILFGNDGENSITVDEIANKLGTSNYEVVCMISKRVPRVYVKDGEIVNIIDEVLNF